MKRIKIYVCDGMVQNVSDLLSRFFLNGLNGKYEFVWDDENPEYLIATEHIYYNAGCMRKFKKLYKNNVITIFWAGECIFPDMNLFDYAVCWDDNITYGDRLCRMTPELFDIFRNNYTEVKDMDEAVRILDEKTEFCNFIYSNPDAHPMRDSIFRAVCQYKKVDSLGKHLNNVAENGTGFSGHEQDVTLLKEKYKFSIAAENARYRGYTSEKLMTSLQAHTIPVYWGNPEVVKEYNSKAFINADDYDSLEELVECIKNVDESDKLWCEMISEPMHTNTQLREIEARINQYRDFFENIFIKDGEDALRKPVGYHPEKYKKIFFTMLTGVWWSSVSGLWNDVRKKMKEVGGYLKKKL